MISDDDHGSLQISLSQTLALNPLSDQKGLRLDRPAGFWTHNLVATSPSVYRDLTAGLWGACSSNLLAPHLQPHTTCISKPSWTEPLQGSYEHVYVSACLRDSLYVQMWSWVYFISAPLTSLSSLPAEPITVLRESKCSYREESAWFTTEIRQQTLLSFSLCTSNTQKHTVRKQSTKNAVTGLHVVSVVLKVL